MFRVAAGTGMTPEILSEYIGKHKQEVIKRYQKLHDAYVNDYEIFHLLKKAVYKPDNRISVNFAKYITDTMNGFFIGIPIKTTNTDEVVSNYIDFLDQYNDQDDNNAELSKICSIYGKGYEMYYNDTEGNIGITYLTPLEAFFIYDDSILERPLYFVRYYLDADNVERGSWSDGSIVQHFVQNGSYRWDGEAKAHHFEGVPATEFIENDERVGIFEGAMSMIDAYNKALSEKANDVDYFADAYLKVLGQRLEKEDVQHIRDDRVINFDGDVNGVEVDFLQKPNGDETQEHLLDRLERLIYQISMVANISDENFGTSSGIAMKYKMQAMSNLAKTKERKFRSGMQRRYRLIFSNPASTVKGISRDAWINNDYKFTLNFPANLAEETDIASKLEGIVSKETQLSVLSVVENVQDELDRIEEEENAQKDDARDRVMQMTFGGVNGEQQNVLGDTGNEEPEQE